MFVFQVLLLELLSHVAIVVEVCAFFRRTKESYKVRQAPVTLLKFVIKACQSEKYLATKYHQTLFDEQTC